MPKTLDLDFKVLSIRPYKAKSGQAYYLTVIFEGQPVTFYSRSLGSDVLDLFEESSDGKNLEPKDGESVNCAASFGIRVYKGDAFLDLVSVAKRG